MKLQKIHKEGTEHTTMTTTSACAFDCTEKPLKSASYRSIPFPGVSPSMLTDLYNFPLGVLRSPGVCDLPGVFPGVFPGVLLGVLFPLSGVLGVLRLFADFGRAKPDMLRLAAKIHVIFVDVDVPYFNLSE